MCDSHRKSALLTTDKLANTPLDKFTKGIFPQVVINFLNKPILKSYPILINYWSVLHFLFGFICASIGVPFFITIFLAIIWELFEIILTDSNIFCLSVPEWYDTILDISFSVLGYGSFLALELL